MAGTPGTWSVTGSLNTGRYAQIAILLPNGKVVVVGGYANRIGCLSSAELYNPDTGTWSVTGSMSTPRTNFAGVLLPNGKVLVCGGQIDNTNFTSSAELYDPNTGTWSVTGSMSTARETHTATLLPNGKVLVAGGNTDHTPQSSAELYDPVTGKWSTTGNMNIIWGEHTATLLENGKVLAVGGIDRVGNTISISSAELYDPAVGTWSVTGSMNTQRCGFASVLLPNGKVLVCGGNNYDQGILSSAELYDPATGTWSVTDSMNTTRLQHTATLLPNGKVLVAGGGSEDTHTTLTKLYDPATNSWSTTGSMNMYHAEHTATLLHNGEVLVAGCGDGISDTTELYNLQGYTSQQIWYLDSTGHPVMEINGIQSGEIGIPANSAVIWLTDQSTNSDVTFMSGTWTVRLDTLCNRSGDVGLLAQVGDYNPDGGIFTPFNTTPEIGYYNGEIRITINTGGTVNKSHYLALRIYDSAASGTPPRRIITDGSSYLISPLSDPGYPLPEVLSGVLLGMGLVGFGIFMFVRRKLSA